MVDIARLTTDDGTSRASVPPSFGFSPFMSASLPPFTNHFAPIAIGYDVVLSDVWGVVHNGVAATPEACDALTRFRKQGGSVVLITNAPRPGDVVARLTLDRLGVPREAYDGIVSSGDVTHALIAARAGLRVFHIGPERDVAIFDDLNAPMAALETADYAVCSGLTDDTVETPQDYHGLIEQMRTRGLPMICANPDIVVERGDQLVYCAGAIADLYAAAGGSVVYAGKPHRPIYELALRIAATARGQSPAHGRVLAIGDSVRTDLKGAVAFGIDCLFVTAGIHAEELGGRDNPDADALADIFAAAGLFPKVVMRRLAW
jgi:HAD superfamily hydrolase (TIGR01459 family)